ncbi:BnaC04g11210D [Brassica napus]|uniref:BnaC04g11210D protein n=1 Tax=Brassica napus TaxID=3708 RepID=A0A078G466_BRANA|nr:BnaC04g11210D [Brassica napus]
MSSRKKRVAKSGGKEIAHPEEVVGNQKLPSRLFATDRYPSKRFNLNASLEYLLLVRDVLEGTDEMERLLGSCFGSLFRLPVRRCAFSAKLVHGLLTRQLVTKKMLELWPVFGAKVIGKCDDPNGAFCRKLRQETKVLVGFPWALQLWAFEAIPGLIARLGGNDEQTLLTYDGEKLPQHTGLGLVDVLHAEHDPKLTVQPMYEPRGDKEDGWGEFDCEILDRKVAYMVGLVKARHKFSKGEWVGGDAEEPIYNHEEATKDKKRKPSRDPSREQEGPALKQRRLSRFFSRKVPGGGHDVAELQAKVEQLSKGFASLEKVVGKQGRLLKKLLAKRKSKFSTSKLSGLGLKRREGRRGGTGPKKLFDGSPPVGSDCSSDEDGDDCLKDTAPLQDGPGLEGIEPELVADPPGKKE